MRNCIRVIFTCLFFSLGNSALACDRLLEGIKFASPVSVFGGLAKNCYGSNSDQHQWVNQVSGIEIDAEGSSDEQSMQASERISQLVTYANSIEVSNSGFSRQELAALIAALTNYQSASTPGAWRVDFGSGATPVVSVPVLQGLNLATPIVLACGNDKITDFDAATDRCKNSLEVARSIARIYGLAHDTFTETTHVDFTAIKRWEDLRMKQWDAYRDQALPQYWWEWGINSWRLAANDGRELIKGVKSGRIPLPEDQLILFHPGVGLQYTTIDAVKSDSGTNVNDSELSPALFLEVIGYNRWRWDASTGDIKDAFGVSIVGVVADNEDVDDFSYGLMFHFRNKYAIAITDDDDGNTGILINFNISELLRDKLNSMP